jgi:hypothetical protein
VGGFASVATELLEDVALARRYKAQGYRIHFRYGLGAVRTRMYRNWEELRQGWTKNLVLLFPDARALARKRFGEFVWLLFLLALAAYATMFVSARGIQFGAPGFWRANLLVMLLWLLALSNYAVFYARVARAHFSYWPSLLSLFGLPGFAALLRRSARAHAQGSVRWRGRAYPTDAQRPSSASNPK